MYTDEVEQAGSTMCGWVTSWVQSVQKLHGCHVHVTSNHGRPTCDTKEDPGHRWGPGWGSLHVVCGLLKSFWHSTPWTVVVLTSKQISCPRKCCWGVTKDAYGNDCTSRLSWSDGHQVFPCMSGGSARGCSITGTVDPVPEFGSCDVETKTVARVWS